MIAAVFLASNTIGAIPLFIFSAFAIAENPEIAGRLAENPTDLSSLTPDPYSGLFSMLFPFVAGLFAFILLVKVLHSRSFTMTITGSTRIRWSHFFVSYFVWAALSFLYLAIYYRIEPSNFTLNNASSSLLYIAAIALVLIPFQAGFEEVIFRGYLMQGFTTMFSYRWFPLVMTSLLFGLMHAFNPEVKEYGFFTMMPQYILFGLIFGIATLLDDGVEAALGAHAANNTFLVIMVTHDSSSLQTPALFEQHSVYPWTEFAGLLISGVIFILILKLVFKWNNFFVVLSKVKNPQTGKVLDEEGQIV